MNKTRMGKRAASLLLSLVMMLSLLPTAAYATMADGVETQGATVSENGTDVSDDSGSSDTGDLQVGDSKDSDGTGDQQVEGSNGSGTADDTTGTEGGADPTDSVNGNDSADPQDDGDAVLPTATTVVSTSEELVAAIAAASDGDTITLGEGEFTTYGNTSPKKSLTFEGVGTNTVWTIGDLNQDAKGEGNGDCSFDGCDTITFKNMTLKVDNKNYRGFIRINHTVVENCTLEGRTAYWGYETAKFVNATFNAPEGDYALWDYSTKAMTFEGCTFNISGKGVNVYVEAGNAGEATRTVEVNNCTVESTKASKAFLNIKNSTQSYDVTLSGTNTVNGLTANGTTGSALYQVETTEVTETTGNPVTVKQENTAGEFETIYEVKKTEKAYVAEVGTTKYDSLQAAIDAAQKGQTVTLLADTRENVTISTYGLTLDLNGRTLNGGTVAGKPALTVTNRVTVKDSSAAQTGTIMREDTAENSGVSSHYVIDIQGKNAFLKFESGTVRNDSGNTSGKGASLIRLGNDNNMSANPTLTIKGGTFTQDNFIAIKVDRGTLHLLGGTVNSANSFAIENWNNAYIKGGTVNGTVSTWVYSTGAAFSKLEISGGTVNGNVASVNYDNAADKQARVYVTGGTVTGTLGTYTYNNGLVAMDETAKATIEVTGGTFKEDPTQYVVEGSAISKNDDGTFGVAKAYLAMVGDTSYYTMDEAFHAAVASGETLTLLRDYTTGSSQNSGSKSFTIDLNGYTWTYTGKEVDCAAFEINYSDVTLTVKNGKVVSSQLAGLIPSAMSGTITYDNSGLVFENVEMTANGHSGIETNGSNTNDTVTLKNSTLNVPNGYGIYFPSSGTLTIDNSVINAKTMGVQICSGSLNVTGDKTAITVTGDGVAKTENDGAIEDGAAISIVNRAGYKGLSNIEVKDGKFKANGTNAAVKAYKWESQTESAFDNSKNVVAVSGGTFSSAVDKSLCADGFIPTQNTDGTYGVKEGKYVAEVKGVKYDSLQAAINAASRNATVRLLADTRENVTISTNYLTLDLNGHTLNGGQVKAKPALTVTARVTVKDSSAAQTGTIMREDTAENSGVSSHYVIDVQGAGWLTFESGNVKNNSGNDSGKGASLVRVGDDSVDKYPGLNIKGGTFTQDNFIVIKVDSGDLFLNGGTLNSANSYAIEDWHRATIKGGTVNGEVAAWTYSGGHNSDLSISGGTVNGNVLSVNYGSAEGKLAKVSITGGTVTGKLGTYTYNNGWTATTDATKATIKVTGGTFSSDPTKYVVEDSGVTKNDDGTYGVAKAYLAKVGDTSYYTMDEAFKAQTASSEAIVLLRDYTTGSTFSSGSIDRTVDLNGHTWTCTGTDANSAAFEINYSDASLTVKNGKVVSSQLVGLIPSAMGGTIKYDNSSLVFEGVEMTTTARSGIENNGNNTNDTVTLRNSTLNVPNGFGIYFPSSGTLTIENSKINAKTMGVQVCSGSLNISGADTAITVSGDGIDKTINDGAIEDGAAISIVERAGYKGLTEIKVEGGKFTAKGDNAAVKAYKWENQTASAFDNSENVVSISGGTFSSEVDKSLCANGYIPTQNADGTYGVKEGKFVAEIGSQGYESLQAAIDAAQDGQTVTLLADAAEDVVISKSITLDLGGKTLTNTNVGKATISVQSGTVTVKNGNVVGGTSYYNIEVTKDANLTLTDVTATAGNNGSSMIDNYGTLTITSGTYTGGLDTVKNEPSAKLNITGGTFTLTKGTSKGFTGVVFNYGELTISGGEFIQSDKSAPWGQAQVIHTDKSGSAAPSTVITGGTFKNLCTSSTTAWTVRATNAAAGATKVSGGAFNKSVKDYYCAEGFIPTSTKDADGNYGVKVGKYVAEVGSKKYETLADAIKAAKNGKTVTLLADVADCGSLTISKNITLDGGGHTISGNSSISVNMPGKAAADVTIRNVTFKDIANGNKLSAFYFSQVKGKLTITGCTFDSIEYEAIQVTPMEGAEVNVSNNVFKAKADGTQVRHIHIEMAYGSGFDCEGQNIKLTVTDNQLHGAVCGDASMGIWWVGTDSTLKVDGNYVEHPETVSITLANGGVHYNRGDLIYPARSQADVDVDDLMPAVIVADKASGESKIKAYSTLAEAINAAQDGQTVRLLADVEQNAQLAIDKSITLDLNGKTIKNTADIWGDNANAILSITKGAKVTITGNGTIDAKENDCYAINMVKGDLTIENGTFYGNVSVVQVQEGTLSVKGGTFDLHQKWEGSSKYLFNCIDEAYVDGSANVAISGGTFFGFDPNVSPEQKVDGKAPSFAAPGAGITKNEDGSFTAVDGMTAQILDKDGNSVKAYSKLADAVAAAEDGQTVRLLADVTLDAQIATGKAITIDGQSKYTIKAAKKLASADGKAGMFYRTQSAKGTLTFLNVTLDGNGVSKIFLNEGGAGETLFDGVTSTNGGGIAYGSGIHISGGGSHATIRNSTLTGSNGTTELNDKNYYAANDLWVGGNVYVTVENSVIGNVFVNSAPSATATNGVVHGQLTITGESTKITYLSGEEEAADKLDKFGNNGSLVKIDSGYVEKVFDKGSYAISGGTFKTEVKKEWCAAGYVPTQNGDGTYGVEVGKFTVMVTSRTTGSDSPVANVAGGGSNITYAQGITVTASAISGYKFVGWFVNEYTGTPYSTDLTCEVKPTDDWTMIAVYEPISGGKFWLTVTASEFTVNGGAVQDSYLYEQFAVGASVTVNFTGSENFLYWVNASNKVVSTEKSYTFIMGSETTLKAVYGKARQNQATVVFISHSDQIISSKAYTTSDTIQFPVPPIKMGCTFTGWSMTESEIREAMANNNGIIQVRALYTEPSIACKVTVIYPDGIGNEVVNAVVGKAVNVTAKDIEGKTFSYWTDDKGTVLGYTKTLKLAPSGDMTVKAVYGENAEVKPVISMTDIDASAGNGYWVVSFTATRAVPEGYELVKQGILYSLDSRCDGEAGKDYLKLTADGTVPDGVYESIGNNKDLNGVTRFNGKVKTAETILYGRGYMILKNSAGEVLYVYADTILSGSYNSLTKSRRKISG